MGRERTLLQTLANLASRGYIIYMKGDGRLVAIILKGPRKNRLAIRYFQTDKLEKPSWFEEEQITKKIREMVKEVA